MAFKSYTTIIEKISHRLRIMKFVHEDLIQSSLLKLSLFIIEFELSFPIKKNDFWAFFGGLEEHL